MTDVTTRRASWHRWPVTSRPRTATLRVAVTAALAVLAVAMLGACGGGETPAEVVVTVTASPEESEDAPSPSTSTSSEAADPVDSDVVGRKFDFGVVTSVDDEGGTDVLVFDRWTDPRVADEALAQQGLEVTTYDLDKRPYTNVNTEVTFRIPVQRGTSFLLHHCAQKDDPVTSRSVSAQELAQAAPADRLVLLTIDPETGYTTGGETLAGC